jgi:hypothetical protein
LTDAIARHRADSGLHLNNRVLDPAGFDAALKAVLAALPDGTKRERIGQVDRLTLTARRRGGGDIALTIADPTAGLTIYLTTEDINSPRSRPLTRLRNTTSDLDARRARAQQRHDDLTVERDRTRQRIGIPWPRSSELAAARRRQAELQAVIDADLHHTHTANQQTPEPPGIEL